MCVLRVTSSSESLADFLQKTALPVYQADDNSFSCDVSKKEWDDVAGQVEDAYRFLLKYQSELRQLLKDYRVDDIRLDLPYYCRLNEQFFLQCDYLPAEFLRLSGELGIGLELSLYGTN